MVGHDEVVKRDCLYLCSLYPSALTILQAVQVMSTDIHAKHRSCCQSKGNQHAPPVSICNVKSNCNISQHVWQHAASLCTFCHDGTCTDTAVAHGLGMLLPQRDTCMLPVQHDTGMTSQKSMLCTLRYITLHASPHSMYDYVLPSVCCNPEKACKH